MRVQLKASNRANVKLEIQKTMLRKISQLPSLKKIEHQKAKERIEEPKEERIQQQTALIPATIVH